MSKLRSHIQKTSIGFVALLQLILLPATHVLHLGCEHPGGHSQTHSSTFEDVAGWCWSSHCCDHCGRSDQATSESAVPTDSSDQHSPPAHQHDEHSCPVCHAAFAARLATNVPLAVPVSLLTVEYVSSYSQSPQNTSRLDVQSRGPPQRLVAG